MNNAGGLGAALGKVDMSYRDLSKLSYISTFMQARIALSMQSAPFRPNLKPRVQFAIGN